MSGFLAGKVWQSNLAPHLKPLAAALADIANDDGTSIYPTVAYVAWLLGRSTRAVQTGLAELRELKVLQLVRKGGGRRRTTEYQLVEHALPLRSPWKDTVKAVNPETVAGFPGKGAVCDIEALKSETETMKPASPPSDPLQEPSKEPLGFEQFWQAYPRKVGIGVCRRFWTRLKPDEALVARMLAAIDQQKRSEQWGKDHGQFIPLPATWLNQARWEDEPYKGLWPKEGERR